MSGGRARARSGYSRDRKSVDLKQGLKKNAKTKQKRLGVVAMKNDGGQGCARALDAWQLASLEDEPNCNGPGPRAGRGLRERGGLGS